MARWEPDARGRLEQAAMALFQERGYQETTVLDIAARAGLTERTFFRYFADKREVLFSGSAALQQGLVLRIAATPQEASPLHTVASAFEGVGRELEGYRDIQYVRARYELVTKHADILERELIKMASLAAAVTKALHARGVPEPAASLTAEAGLAVFKIGFERWVSEKKPKDLAGHIRAAVDVLRSVAAEGSGPKKRPTRATRPAAVATAPRAKSQKPVRERSG